MLGVYYKHMKKFKRLLIILAAVSVLVAGFAGIMLTLDLMSATEAQEMLTKILIVFGIVAGCSAALIAVLSLNKDS